MRAPFDRDDHPFVALTPRARKTGHRLLAFALALPGAYEDHPWGETVAKVGKKVFVFGLGDSNGMSVKLTDSHAQALLLEGAVPPGTASAARAG